ncbi:MAG TPA: tRNA lysidine(34) synthetase TilS [Candidatus Saccharimonadales bacterium]|nr:tRNA lysidine(34) synthetase TilS [Candidatus Saccharimonadales bacterium]
MRLKLLKGRYVVAVSGGVDSIVLLDVLSKLPEVEIIVAHFNHGIRPGSAKDQELVKNAARKYNLPFEAGYGRLGFDASEEQAREARYKFLDSLKQKNSADAIITAHHQDDLIETAILNILRGTGRRGLSSIIDNPDVLRPMLGVAKKDILTYARSHDLEWLEDPSNKDEKYLRNYIRHKIIPQLTKQQKRQLLRGLNQTASINRILNQEIANLSQKIVKRNAVQREKFTSLPTEVANEVLMHWLRQNEIRQFDQNTIQRLAVAIKTARAGTRHDVIKGAVIEMSPTVALLMTSVN